MSQMLSLQRQTDRVREHLALTASLFEPDRQIPYRPSGGPSKSWFTDGRIISIYACEK
jgi:hypothetical protein